MDQGISEGAGVGRHTSEGHPHETSKSRTGMWADRAEDVPRLAVVFVVSGGLAAAAAPPLCRRVSARPASSFSSAQGLPTSPLRLCALLATGHQGVNRTREASTEARGHSSLPGEAG